MCCQPTELILGFFFPMNFQLYSPIPQDIVEIRSFNNPPSAIALVIDAVMVMLGKESKRRDDENAWTEARQVGGGGQMFSDRDKS